MNYWSKSCLFFAAAAYHIGKETTEIEDEEVLGTSSDAYVEYKLNSCQRRARTGKPIKIYNRVKKKLPPVVSPTRINSTQ